MLVYGLRSIVALIIRGLLRIYNRFEIIGHENLRTNRSLVIVANHCSHLDTLCLLAALPLRNCIARFLRRRPIIFPKCAASLDRRRDRERVAICTANAGPAKFVALRTTAP